MIYRVGDLLRISKTAEALRITRVRGGGRRYWEPAPQSLWGRLTGKHSIKVLERWPTFVSVERGKVD